MKIPSFELGDIVRWEPSRLMPEKMADYCYGMVIREPELIKGGEYFYGGSDKDSSDSNMTFIEPMTAITVFSFKEQKVKILYHNPEDIPLIIEKVDFSDKIS
jgi:hypothetical protein